MSREESSKFFISQKAVLIRDGKCLIMEFAHHNGFWDLPGGHLDGGETNTEAFKRELQEETGLDKYEYHGVVDYEIWYHGPDRYPICGIVSLIENNEDEIKISPEHSQMKWVTEVELDDYNFLWPACKRMTKKGFEKHRQLKQ